MRRGGLVLAVAVLSGAVGGATPSGAERSSDLGPYDHFEFKYTSKKPGTKTGFRYRVRLHQDGDSQPPTVRELRLAFAKGTRVDRKAVARCRATDEQISDRGTDACPSGSRVARGSAGVYVGSADPTDLPATVFNTKRGVVAVLTTDKGAVVKILRGRWKNALTLVVPVPPTPLPGGKQAALVRFSLDIAAGTRKRPWVRTPTTCTRKGWDVVYAPLFDPIGRVRLVDNTRCRA